MVKESTIRALIPKLTDRGYAFIPLCTPEKNPIGNKYFVASTSLSTSTTSLGFICAAPTTTAKWEGPSFHFASAIRRQWSRYC